mgnify:CR=1 FL=1
MSERQYDFFGFQDEKLIYDERKKRFVHTKNLPASLQRQYQNANFKTVSFLLPYLIHFCTAKTWLSWKWKGGLRFQAEIRRINAQIYELLDQDRDEKTVETNGIDEFPILLRKYDFDNLILFSSPSWTTIWPTKQPTAPSSEDFGHGTTLLELLISWPSTSRDVKNTV